MTTPADSGAVLLWVGATAIALAVAVLIWFVAVPSQKVATERRRFGAAKQPDTLTQVTQVTTERVGTWIGRGSRSQRWAYTLDRAGIRYDLGEFAVIVAATLVTTFAIGTLVGGLFVGLLLMLIAAGSIVAFVSLRADRRKSAFADSLEDLVQLLATNLRAGHSVLQALDDLAQEMEEPANTEIARAVNEVRLGRDLAGALEETADRMESDDFRWVAQAIAIHRQVGGNLADVLDTVGYTIRERNQIRRQVKTLSAEGRASAWVLLALPVFVALAMSLLNPDYLAVLTTRLLGQMLIAGAVVLMIIGALWLRKIVQVEF
jgi:tight adherence protein B